MYRLLHVLAPECHPQGVYDPLPVQAHSHLYYSLEHVYKYLPQCMRSKGILSCKTVDINPLNAELNPTCHLLALLAHLILHFSR